MAEQIRDLIHNYPWILVVLAAALFLGIGIAAAVVLLMRMHEKKMSKPFEVIDVPKRPEQEAVKPQPSAMPYSDDDDDDLTRRLFDYPEMELKSYQLALQDLQFPGQVYRTNVNDRITIGRKEQCVICIPNNTLSGEHCEIVLKNGRLCLHDLNSTNGTFVNGNPNRISEVMLESGDIIEMGSMKLRVQVSVIKL
ncbi:MAG: FHA domain-containing protein [Lachnospiraceae bacterium]|nr:FHA domain-containing protein [Lachnospiraceae bacterium]